ncbi:unnamed protein product [Choristocarpus tenellus]
MVTGVEGGIWMGKWGWKGARRMVEKEGGQLLPPPPPQHSRGVFCSACCMPHHTESPPLSPFSDSGVFGLGEGWERRLGSPKTKDEAIIMIHGCTKALERALDGFSLAYGEGRYTMSARKGTEGEMGEVVQAEAGEGTIEEHDSVLRTRALLEGVWDALELRGVVVDKEGCGMRGQQV